MSMTVYNKQEAGGSPTRARIVSARRLREQAGTIGARIRYRLLRSSLAAPIKLARSLALRGELARRKALARHLPSHPVVIAAARKLDNKGYVRLDHLVDPAALAELALAAERKIAAGSQAEPYGANLPAGTSRKGYWTRLLDTDLVDGAMPGDTPFTRFALQPQILGVLAQSFGTLPLLDYVLLTHSRPTADAPSQSQLWHRDHDDVRVIKLFVYLTDVTSAECGPFTFLPGPQSDRAGKLGPSHASDSALFARANASDLEQMIAPRLSAFAVETSRCLHMGSRVASGHERLLYTATYITAPRIFASNNRFMLVDEGEPVLRAVMGEGLS